MRVESPAFNEGGAIPAKHTCEGEDTAPPLRFHDVPKDAKSLVLLVDDPDAPDPKAPRRVWLHWLVWDLPPDTKELPEGGRPLPPGATEATNDSGDVGYGGPCPPIGRHRYFFKLFALDTLLGLPGSAKRADVEKAMEGHVLAQAQVMGTYEKAR